MSLLKSSTDEKPRPVWFIVERDHGSTVAFSRGSRDAALDDFANWLVAAAAEGNPFSAWQRGRRLWVKGPDVHTRTEGDDAVLYVADDEIDDPPLIALAALHAVLSADEYALYVQGPVARALLVS